MKNAIAAIFMVLAGCGRPPKDICNDYRLMTYARSDGIGWSDVYSGKVCVVSEKRLHE